MRPFRLIQQIFSQSPKRPITTTSIGTGKIAFITDQDKREKVIKQRIGIVGVPTKCGQRKDGVDLGPTVLREASLIQKLEEVGADVYDYGNVDISQLENDEPAYNLLNPKTHAVNSSKISDAVSRVVSDGRICLTLGGDHSLGFGSVHGHASVHRDVGVIWIDAHADLNTPLSSGSGNFHGMPVSFLVHELQEYIPSLTEFSDLKSCINSEDIVYIGLRAIDPAEKLFLDKFNIKNFSMEDIDEKGIVAVVKETLDHLNSHSKGTPRPLHLSIDIDSLDPSVAASTGTPVRGGLTLRELLYTTEEIQKTGQLSVVDLVEVNPELKPEMAADTIDAAINVLMTIAGDKRGGVVPIDFVVSKPEDIGVSSRADEYVDYDQE